MGYPIDLLDCHAKKKILRYPPKWLRKGASVVIRSGEPAEIM
jgi:hypothetical protein